MSERIDTQGHGVKRRKDREFFDAQEIFPWISHYSPSSQEICFFSTLHQFRLANLLLFLEFDCISLSSKYIQTAQIADFLALLIK